MATFLLVNPDNPDDDSFSVPRAEGSEATGGARAVSLLALLGILRRHRWLVFGIVLLALSAATFLVLREAPVYRASAVVRLVDGRRALTGPFAEAPAPERRGSTVDPLLSLVSLMHGRGLLGTVVDDEGLRLQVETPGLPRERLQQVELAELMAEARYELHFTPTTVRMVGPTGEVRGGYGTPIELEGIRLTVAAQPPVANATLVALPREAAIDMLLQDLQIRPRVHTDIVDVAYSATDPALAQRVVNAVVENFQASDAGSLQEQAARRRLFLEEQLARNDSMLLDLQQRITEYRSQQHIYNPGALLEAQQTGLLTLEIRTEELSAERRMYESILFGLERSPNGAASERLRILLSAPGIAANPVIAQIFTQLTQYQTERDSLITGPWASAATHPDVQRLNTLIRNREESLVSAVRGHIAYLNEQIASYGGLRARSAGSIRSLLQADAAEAELTAQAEPLRHMGEQLREEYQRAQLAEAVAVGQFEIVDLASQPYRPVDRGLVLKLVIGLMLGLGLGFGAAFAREAIDTSIRRRQELESVLRAPTLAVVPRTLTSVTQGRRWLLPAGPQGKRWLPSFNVKRSAALLPEPDAPLEGLVTISEPRSPGAESYRMLRTGILFTRDGKRVKSVVVTSAVPEEGKTTTAANLAIAVAQEGLRTLIIDGDLRRARLHRLFRTGRSPGLVQVVQEQVPLEDAIRATSLNGLDILPAGLLPPGPSDLLASSRIRTLLQQLTDRYDLIILDAPPLLAVADAATITALADGVLLVVRAGKTARGAMEQARQQLTNVGAHLLGAVLNDPDAQLVREENYYYAYDYSATVG
jgi:tyrosine-protein kinase Etk/Wzc